VRDGEAHDTVIKAWSGAGKQFLHVSCLDVLYGMHAVTVPCMRMPSHGCCCRIAQTAPIDVVSVTSWVVAVQSSMCHHSGVCPGAVFMRACPTHA
jgi:hypothetical protein